MTSMSISADLIHKIYGPQFLGTLTATFLSGTNTVQMVVYFRMYPEDKMRLKVLVAVVWGLDIVHTAFLWSNLWCILVAKFGQLFYIIMVKKPYLVPGFTVIGSSMILITHLFYVYRIFLFTQRNYWITAPVLILVLCYVACCVGSVIILYKFQTFPGFINAGYTWIISLGFTFAAVSDIVIMIILLVILRSSRQQMTSLNSMNLIDKHVIYTLETGSFTAFMAIAIMIIWLTGEHNDIYLSIYMSLPKAYATTLLGLLNTRYRLRRAPDSQSDQGAQGHNTMIRFANPVGTTPTLARLSSEGSAPTYSY